MRMDAGPATDRRDLSEIAYAFMGSKAMFAALEIGVFTQLATEPRRLDELAESTGIATQRLQTLLRALAAIGLVVIDQERYANAPASQRYLVRGAPGAFGEYFRLQISRHIYPALVHLDAGIAGTGRAFDTLGDLLADPGQAETFIAGQHAGSLAPARVLADRVPLGTAERLLDVGGGSGAFSIAFCQHNPGLRATVLDFPAVVRIASGYCDRAGLAGRIDLLAGEAVHTAWPDQQDVVLLSYLLSALGDRTSDDGSSSEIEVVLAKAHACLRPGGRLIVHDFMLHDTGPGPATAALWFLQYLAYRPDATSFTAGDLGRRLHQKGFADIVTEVLIPEITQVIVARRVDTE